jgi:precorrin isomerase
VGIVAIITTLLPILTNLLGTTGIISPTITALISKLAGAIPALVAGLIQGKTVTADILVILQGIQTEVNALKSSNALFTLNQANEINALDLAISNAITSYQASTTKTDPSNLTPLPETL